MHIFIRICVLTQELVYYSNSSVKTFKSVWTTASRSGFVCSLLCNVHSAFSLVSLSLCSHYDKQKTKLFFLWNNSRAEHEQSHCRDISFTGNTKVTFSRIFLIFFILISLSSQPPAWRIFIRYGASCLWQQSFISYQHRG